MPSTPVFIGEAYLAPKVAIGFVAAAVVIGLFLALFRFSRGGVALKATAADQGAAYSAASTRRVSSPSPDPRLRHPLRARAFWSGRSAWDPPTMGVFGLRCWSWRIIGGSTRSPARWSAVFWIGLVEVLAGASRGEFALVVTFALLLVLLMGLGPMACSARMRSRGFSAMRIGTLKTSYADEALFDSSVQRMLLVLSRFARSPFPFLASPYWLFRLPLRHQCRERDGAEPPAIPGWLARCGFS